MRYYAHTIYFPPSTPVQYPSSAQNPAQAAVAGAPSAMVSASQKVAALAAAMISAGRVVTAMRRHARSGSGSCPCTAALSSRPAAGTTQGGTRRTEPGGGAGAPAVSPHGLRGSSETVKGTVSSIEGWGERGPRQPRLLRVPQRRPQQRGRGAGA